MKRAVFLHGTDGSPEGNWFPWLKAKLEAAGYEVWAPLLPGNDAPNRETYGDFLFGSGWDFTDNIVVGHSSGAVELLNLLMDKRCPRIKLAVVVSAWTGGIPHGYPADTHIFDHLFPPKGFKFRAIRAKADKIVFLHGSDDPYCPVDQGWDLASRLKAPITIVPNGHHLGAQFSELPPVWNAIEPSL